MTTLPNAKHERFAQALADGKTQLEAHGIAGYKANRHTGSALAREPHISARVSEILTERESIQAKGVAKAIERTAINKAWIIDRLVENVERAMQAEPVYRDGVATGEYQYAGSVANKALELLGKEVGMFVDRQLVQVGEFDEMKPDELRDLRSTVAAERARRAGSEDSRGAESQPAGELPALH